MHTVRGVLTRIQTHTEEVRTRYPWRVYVISFPKSESRQRSEASRPLFTALNLPGFQPPTTLSGNPPSDAEHRDASSSHTPLFVASLRAALALPPLPRLLRLRHDLCALVNLSNYPYRELRRGSIQYQPLNQPLRRILASHPTTSPLLLPISSFSCSLASLSVFSVSPSVFHAPFYLSSDSYGQPDKLPETYFLRARHGQKPVYSGIG